MDNLNKLRLFRNVNGMNRNWYPEGMRRGYKNSIHPSPIRENHGSIKSSFCYTFIKEEGKSKILKGVTLDVIEDKE